MASPYPEPNMYIIYSTTSAYRSTGNVKHSSIVRSEPACSTLFGGGIRGETIFHATRPQLMPWHTAYRTQFQIICAFKAYNETAPSGYLLLSTVSRRCVPIVNHLYCFLYCFMLQLALELAYRIKQRYNNCCYGGAICAGVRSYSG
jgi:hypothetical protein